ncbi:MAG: hypothetical protein M3Y77_07210 [Actinomycetota bacterium]|nr:hypothetical protein [Actinomycetota bacterium]
MDSRPGRRYSARRISWIFARVKTAASPKATRSRPEHQDGQLGHGTVMLVCW